jgi:hypothetical protein
LFSFNEFYHGRLDIYRFNYGIITLLPKVQVADKLQAFRPIFLIKVILKISTKILNYREVKVANKAVLEYQITFIKDRCILDGVFMLHEIHISKKAVVLFKVDFEKWYDKPDKNFFFQVFANERVRC